MRTELNRKTDPEKFRNFYWLKEELLSFCKKYKLPKNGSKDELAVMIYQYLKTGRIVAPTKNEPADKQEANIPLSLDAIIPEGYRNDERHRSFFKSQIGDHFKFNVPFMNWMKENAGKTYRDAVLQWNRIMNQKKKGKKTKISSQFQYNQYTRDFFAANPDAIREDAITCWNYKKSIPGHNKYEEEDLIALEQ